MRKIFTILTLLLAMTISVAHSQTIVTTQPTNKNVVLEDYTGIHCQYCPQGHVIAQAILDNHPGRAVVLSIHQGNYAVPNAGEPDYRTPFGDPLAGQTGLTGYPSGTVNRHVFSGSSTALGRGDWTSSSEIILQQPSPVNVGINSSFDSVTRVLTVQVELYYTANSAVPSNYINVALIQDHIFGPQTAGGAGNFYEHMHMLRYLITGQWGDVVSTTTAGTLVERTYTYTVPAGYNNIPCNVNNCQVAVFVTQTHQETISGDVVDAIGGTNLFVGNFSTSDSTMQLGNPAVPTLFNFSANSNLTGSEPFVIKMVTDAPSDWNALFTVNGQSYSDSVVLNLDKNIAKDIELSVTPGTTAGFQKYTFEMKSVNNPKAPVQYFTFYILSNVNTLLVNAMGDNNATLHQDVYINGLTAAGSDKMAVMGSDLFKRASDAAILTQVLNVFYNVAWTFPAFTDPEAVALKSFIDNGGNVLVSGQDIGWDVMSSQTGSHPTPEAQSLYTNYLKAQFINDGSSANNKLIAETTDLIYGGVATSNIVDVNGGNMYPDQISPLSDATATFYYDAGKTKTCAVKSLFTDSKVIYFGVGLEMVQTESVRNDIIKKTYDWFMEGVGMQELSKNAGASLEQNVPNPSLSETMIRINMDSKGMVRLNIFDLNGREISQILNKELPSGPTEVKVYTSGMNPGVYYYSLQTAGGKLTKKMVVLK